MSPARKRSPRGLAQHTHKTLKASAKPFVCASCGAVFEKASSLARHITMKLKSEGGKGGSHSQAKYGPEFAALNQWLMENPESSIEDRQLLHIPAAFSSAMDAQNVSSTTVNVGNQTFIPYAFTDIDSLAINGDGQYSLPRRYQIRS